MHPELAWLPFLAALFVAFFAGVAFARINQRLRLPGSATMRRGGASGLYGPFSSDIVLSIALVAILLTTVVVLLVAAAVLLHVLK